MNEQVQSFDVERTLSDIRDSISLEEIISYMPGHVYWKDVNGAYLGCNLHLANVLKLKSPQEIVGKKVYDLVSDEISGDLVDSIDTAVMSNNREVVIEEEGLDSEGKWAFYFTKKQPLHDAKGRVVGMLGVSLDITKRKLAEQAAEKAKEEAEAASRAKTEFLANMSHDVKTPLSGVIAIAELLAQRFQGGDKKLIEDIQRCGKTLMSFFENCIELSKMDIVQLQEVSQVFSMAKIVEAIHTLFVPSATAKKLVFNVHQDAQLPPTLVGNQINIYRVVLNLIGNAIKFTPSGSVTLSIVLDHKVDDENIVIKIIVQDTGIGIPKDKQNIIFEKLQRLTPSYYNRQEGHGIGLYIVDQYVKAMQGTIEVESTEGKGSTFTVTIPLKVAAPDETNIVIPPTLSAHEVPAAKVPEPVSQLLGDYHVQDLGEDLPRVLLVEDSPLIQAVTKEILQTAGARVDVASCGKEAIDLFVPGKYALIYMDIGLPDMDGYEVSQRLRAIEDQAHAVRTPILALTAHAAVDVKTFCAGAGMQGVLNKPLSCKQAQQALERYVLRKSTMVDGLQLLDVSEPVSSHLPSRLEVIDLPGCVAVVESEARAREMLAMVTELLDSTFVPEIQAAYEKHDDLELRKALHKFLGSLCYISTPALKQATLDLQVAVKEKLATRERAFQAFLHEVKQFKIAYSTLQQVGML